MGGHHFWGHHILGGHEAVASGSVLVPDPSFSGIVPLLYFLVTVYSAALVPQALPPWRFCLGTS